MIRTLFYIIIFSMQAGAQTYNFSFTTLSGDYSRPFAGSEKWQGTTPSIVSGVPEPQGFYRRMSALEFVTSDSNVYDWTRLRTAIKAAADANQLLSWGYMTVTPFAEESGFNVTTSYDGGYSSYPEWLHNLMQAQDTTDWIGDAGHWIPNYNSSHYHYWLRKWNTALANFFDTATVVPTAGPKSGQTIQVKHLIGALDIRGIGSYGEWHQYSSAPGNSVFNFPAGTFPTIPSFKAIIDAHTQPLSDYRLVVMIAGFDGQWLQNTWIPPEVGVYLISRSTSKGLVGWRRDQWGANDSYLDRYLKNNPNSFGGYRMDTAIMNRWKYAPITGEPPGGPDFYNGNNMGSMAMQVRTYRPAWIGNGNYGGGYSSGGAWQDTMRLAFQLCGFHLRLTGGSAVISSNFTLNLKWRNYGLAPTYNNWTVQYSLRSGSSTVWTGNSSFDPYLFLDSYGEQTKSDVFSMPAIPAGNYALHVTVKDPNNYLQPLPLQIAGRQSDGSYFLSNVSIPSGTSNKPPSANAGPNQTITLPDDDAVLTGSLSGDEDGTIADYEWTQLSGPSTATMSDATAATNTVSDLVEGVYVFNLTVTDDDGDISSDQVTITVTSAANEPPIAVATADPIVMTYPTNSVYLDGSGSTDDNAVTSYLWQKISGPAPSTFSDTDEAEVTVSNLVPGVYIFRLTVGDGTLTNSDDVIVLILPEPVTHERKKWNRRYKAF